LSVNLAIFLLLLYHFHQFPLLSLLYNLFFPLAVSAALFSLLISLIAHLLLPPLAPFFFRATDLFTAQLLDVIAYPPLALDISVRCEELAGWLIPIYLFGLFCLSLKYKYS
jgi:competence protein ComEC